MRRGLKWWVCLTVGVGAIGNMAGCVDDFPAIAPVDPAPNDAAAPADADRRDAATDMSPGADAAPGLDGALPDRGPCMPSDEVCNGADDDCDDRIDEQQPRRPCALTAGVCSGDSAGCLDGNYAACNHGLANANYQAEETRCDSLDNDCDGRTDEACTCDPGEIQDCGLNIGACLAGTQRCEAGAFGPCEGAFEGGLEVCNGEDDDCDAVTDEQVSPTPCDTGRDGVCDDGEQACGGPCLARVQASVEVCDGLDNDCDGTTDEDSPVVDCLIDPDRPACGMGQTYCVDGAVACINFQNQLDATCDGIDDDCDDRLDEDFVPVACAVDACAGSQVCEAGAVRCVFEPNADTDIGPNDIDEDCDGAIDEGPLTLYIEDLLVGGDGRRPGVARRYVPGYAEDAVRGDGAFDAGASQAPVVDWVFRPSLAGGIDISSTALRYDFADRVNSPLSSTPPAKGPLSYGEQVDPLTTAANIVELHANIGVTFDLDVLRAQYPDRTLVRFRGRTGSSDRGEVQVEMLLDGRRHYLSACETRRSSRLAYLQTIDVVALANTRFMTFAALDCDNDTIDNRHGLLLDARIEVSARP
ncbi:MAG: hypothetical protein ACI9U2_002928 [Bradymonadia bacterium]|jgi:hypothetical protein